MPRGGHNRKPTVLKLLSGAARPDRIKNEPRPRSLAPPCPRWLPPAAKRAWRDLAPRLERLGVLTEVDGPAFAMMVTHYALAAEAAKVLREEGLLVSDPEHKAADGSVPKRKHPALQILRDHSAAFRAYAAAFGLTPADRGRISVPAPDEPDEYEEFLRWGQSIRERGGKSSGR